MAVQALNHFNVQTTDLEKTREFYERVLGFKSGPRPNFDFPGYWLYCGDMPVVHLTGGQKLVVLESPDEIIRKVVEYRHLIHRGYPIVTRTASDIGAGPPAAEATPGGE